MTDPTQWLNENRFRVYPFIEDSILTDDSDTLSLPNSTIIDLSVTVYGSYGINIKLYSVEVAPSGTTVTFTFQYGPDAAPSFATIITPGSVTES